MFEKVGKKLCKNLYEWLSFSVSAPCAPFIETTPLVFYVSSILGMADWLSFERSRMERHNREGVSMIKRELEKVYTDFTHHGNLEEFFKHRSSDGSNALKKGNIETPSPTIFTDLSTVSP